MFNSENKHGKILINVFVSELTLLKSNNNSNFESPSFYITFCYQQDLANGLPVSPADIKSKNECKM